MKSFLATGFFLLCCFWVQAQTITGKVYSQENNEVVVGATVYYGGSMQGTITNKQGTFELKAKQEQIPVVVSCIGYYTTKVTYQPGHTLVIHLIPKQTQLKTVTIRVNEMDRAEEIRLFTREFIGISKYAQSCTITNINDINFSYNKKTKILTASCDTPLTIVNKKLGFTITYFLDDFSLTPKGVYFAGNYIFRENEAPASQAQTEIKNNRENVYQFSRMQLIRALWNHKLAKSGFKIYTPYYDPLTEDSLIVRDSLKQQYVKLPPRIIITQSNNNRRDFSYIIPTAGLVFIDKDGYYGPGLKWDGALVRQRIGDLLPFEYQSEKELKGLSAHDLADIKQAESERMFAAALANKKAREAIPANEWWNEFGNIVLQPNNVSDTQKVVRKWQQPIRYKIYGAFNNKNYDAAITDAIRRMLEKMALLAGCEVTQTNTDSLANLLIVIGKPDEFAGIMPVKALQDFGVNRTNTCYYAATPNGLSRVIACIDPGHDFSLQTNMLTIAQKNAANDRNREDASVVNQSTSTVANHISRNDNYNMADKELQELWCKARKIVMNSLGFAGLTDKKESIFYKDISAWMPEDKISPSDTRIIEALYNPQVKSGMTELEVYAVVKAMFSEN